MTAAAVVIGGLIVLGLGAFSQLNILFAFIAAFLICGAGNVINDYRDVDSDKVNRPDRPIPSGKIRKEVALNYSRLLFIIGIIISIFINTTAIVIAVANSLILMAYPFLFKDKLLIGNIAISYLVGSAFLFGGAAAGNLLIPGILALLAGLANLSREIAKDLEDIEGDKLSFLKRIASKIKKSIAERFDISGGKPTIRHKRLLVMIGFLSLVAAVVLSPLPYYLGIMGLRYLVVVILADIFFLFSAMLFLKAKKSRQYNSISKLIKFGMFMGLVAFIVGVL